MLTIVKVCFLYVASKLSVTGKSFCVLLNSITFSFRVLIVSRFSPGTSKIGVSYVRFFIYKVLYVVPAVLFRRPRLCSVLRT